MQNSYFNSKYIYIKSLGRGGCGEVFLAENKTLGNLWAIKEILKGEKTSVSGYIEPEILKRLNHPALPRICDVYEDDSKIYIVEDYIEGISLKQKLDTEGRFDEKTVIDWTIQLCGVLEYLHCQKPNPIIYGDMKPHNIILTKDGFVKLVDFGVSMLIPEANEKSPKQDSGRLQNDTVFIGTKGYAAPEQYLCKGISPETDIFSLGITAIQLLTGFDPLKSAAESFFEDEKDFGDISPGLANILKKSIQADPKMRYRTALHLLKDLRNYSLYKETAACHGNASTSNQQVSLTKIIAITGARGTGVSTITAALAEHTARTEASVCIADLSISGDLGKSLLTDRAKESSKNPQKINSNLFYINLNNLSDIIPSDNMIFSKQLGQLQEDFSYIFIDVDIALVKFIVQYLNHIIIVSDMNPYNLSGIVPELYSAEMEKLQLKTAMIINKFYKGELNPKNILQGAIQGPDVQEMLQELFINSRVFTVPYDPKIYFKWMYSYFSDPMRFDKYINKDFKQAIQSIIASTFVPAYKKHSYF